MTLRCPAVGYAVKSQFSGGAAMNRISNLAVIVVSLLMLAVASIGDAVGQEKARQISDVERVNAASRVFMAAISARDIHAMDKLWAHEPYVTFMGPLSTTLVAGWDGVKKAWEMRFNQFERVTVSLAESHVHTNGTVAWAVGVEKVRLLRKNGETLSFDTFVTTVFEKQDGRWLMVSHQATPIFREVK
jgi:ketosteroid isomerase-like protein